jgi:hypothetical protein
VKNIDFTPKKSIFVSNFRGGVSIKRIFYLIISFFNFKRTRDVTCKAGLPLLWFQREKWLLFQVLTKEKWETTNAFYWHAPPKIGNKNWFFWRKIDIFHTKYLNFFLSAPPPPNLKSRINILQWILTKLGTYLVLRRVWNPIDFQGHWSKVNVR